MRLPAALAAVPCLLASAMVAAQDDFVAPRTPWGDPDLRGIFPGQHVWDGRIPLERSREAGEEMLLSDPDYAARVATADESDGRDAGSFGNANTVGLGQWLRTSPMGRRNSLVISPADGRLPPLTPEARELFELGRSSYKPGQVVFNWVDDMDAFDRCITRGFPAVMLPMPYNNGMRVFQSPGFVVLQLEMFGTRVIPLAGGRPSSDRLRAWHGISRGHWEGSTLVIETGNIVAGDSATHDVARRAGSPLPNRDFAALPMGPQAQTVERLTLTGPETLHYELTYSDPATFVAPWTVAFDRPRDDAYAIFEYACHEGNEHVRGMIEVSRRQRNQPEAP